LELILMNKIRITIDPDIDFGVAVWAEAFGFQAVAGFRRKPKSSQVSISGAEAQATELSPDEYEEIENE
jgi:hypothetical protein